MKKFKLNPAVVQANFRAEVSLKELSSVSSWDFSELIYGELENREAKIQQGLDQLPTDYETVEEYIMDNTRIELYVRGNEGQFSTLFSYNFYSNNTANWEQGESSSTGDDGPTLEAIIELFNNGSLEIDEKRGLCQFDESIDENDCYASLFIVE